MFDSMPNQFMQQPQMSPEAMFAMQQSAQAAETEQAINQILSAQMNHERQKAMGVGAKGLGMGIKAGLTPPTPPTFAGTAAFNGGTVPAQTYVQGGPATMGPMAVASKALGAAGVGYSAYQGINEGQKSVGELERAVRSGDLSPEQEDKFRRDLYHGGVIRSGTGAAAGGLSGLSMGGPIGAAIGATLGSLGGTWQSARAYSDQPDAFREVARAGMRDMKDHPWTAPLTLGQLPFQEAAVGVRKLFHR